MSISTQTAVHIDEVTDSAGTVLASLLAKKQCSDNCDPGNCEAAHAERFGSEPT